MTSTAIAILIGVLAFVIVLATILVGRVIYRKRHRKVLYQSRFARADIVDPQNEDRLRLSGELREKKGIERKGRFYAFGIVIAAVFGTLLVKLWSLQILANQRYVEQATENMSSTVSLPAVRGRILDRNGVELVGNRPATMLTGKKSLADNRPLVHRLSLVLGIPKGIIRRNLLDDTQGVQSDHIIATDVPMRTLAFVSEHKMLFPGVNVESRTVRYYPYGTMAAHVLGYTGPVTEEVLQSQADDAPVHYEPGDSIGKDGAEAAFEVMLQGMHGARVFKVDVDGNPTGILSESDPIAGDDVCLTIDAQLQQASDRILAETIRSARDMGNPNASAGALVVLDVRDGGVLAMSSYPTFNPTDLSDGISADLWEQLTGESTGYPLTNRAIAGQYPAASTFKAFTSLAGLTHGIIDDGTAHYCSGIWYPYDDDNRWGQQCWTYPAGHGAVNLEQAIQVSCDVFFYNVGFAFYQRWVNQPKEARVDDFQDYIRSWGFASTTGIDLPGEAAGRLPNAEWKLDAFSDTPEDAQWQPGDMTNLAIGQGDLLITPLQLANSYAGVARGKLITPHIFYKIVDKDGEQVVAHNIKEVEAQPKFEPKQRERVLEGLKLVVQQYDIFASIPATVAGKTGTGEVQGKGPLSWFVAFAPAEDPQYCAACVVEEGGSGNGTAIVAVQHIFAHIYGIEEGAVVTYQSTAER
ncbi:MAG: penicillin-binding protein 2 [Coriobacteriales bacterium]|jgi:penicillin-binding protein 2|nr:penicillin-binding protein 2 [Coriobacteriales bacterium]